MTPEKRALIKQFVENKEVAEAVRSALLEQVAPEGIATYVRGLDRTIPNAHYAEQVKARAEAADMLEKGFAQLHHIANGVQGVQSPKKEHR